MVLISKYILLINVKLISLRIAEIIHTLLLHFLQKLIYIKFKQLAEKEMLVSYSLCNITLELHDVRLLNASDFLNCTSFCPVTRSN